MSTTTLVEALAIPADARLDQRVPKKLLFEEGAPSAADKRYIQDGIDELTWVAALKPSNIGVPLFKDAIREYVEIAVLAASLRPQAKAPRLLELIHRAIPYPLVLVTRHGGVTTLSLAHKRFSQAERSQVVVEDLVSRTAISSSPSAVEAAFLASLPIAAQPAQNLFTLYQGWLDRVAGLEVARLTGLFVLADTPSGAAGRKAALDACTRIQREAAALRANGATEKQFGRRVELNLELKRLEVTLAELMKTL